MVAVTVKVVLSLDREFLLMQICNRLKMMES